jgi:oligopeptide transport system substrate-binding protein
MASMKVSTVLFLFLTFLHSESSSATTLNRGNGAEPDSLNIHLAQGINSQNILLDLYEGLMTFDAKGQIVNGVIERYEVNENNKQWTFYFKPDLKWSDGTPLVAADFIHAWQHAIKPAVAAPYRHLFENMMNKNNTLDVKAVGDDVLQVNLNYPDAGLLNKLVLPIFYPLPQHVDDTSVSNGAFRLSEWNIQENIKLRKNPHFHAVDQVYFNQVVYWVTENQNSELLRFRANELDITETIPDHQIDWLKQNLADELRIAPYYGTFFLGLNLSDKHLKNKALRHALSAAIDRKILVDKVLKSGQQIANRIIPPENKQQVDLLYDLNNAKQWLLESGFKVETERLEILYNNSDNQKKVALAVAAMWRQNLGIKSRLKNQEWKMFVVTRKGNNKQVFRSGWIADYYDPMNFLELFQSNSHFNFYQFEHQNFDAIINQLQQTTNQQHFKTLIQDAETVLANELPVIPLYHYVSRHLVSTKLAGFHDNLMDKHLSRYLFKR